MFDAASQRQLIRYGSVGVVSNLLLYLLYLGLTDLGMGHKLTMSLVYVLGVTVTFVINRNWSFGHDGALHHAFARYILAYAIGYLLNLGLLWFGADRLGLPHEIVQAAAVLIVAASLFLMHRYWVFTPGEREVVT